MSKPIAYSECDGNIANMATTDIIVDPVQGPRAPRVPRVTFRRGYDTDKVDAFVDQFRPGWYVDWEEPEQDGPRGYASRSLRRRRGRPARAGTAGAQVTVRLIAAEREAWERAAGDWPLAEWVREVCNERAASSPRRRSR